MHYAFELTSSLLQWFATTIDEVRLRSDCSDHPSKAMHGWTGGWIKPTTSSEGPFKANWSTAKRCDWTFFVIVSANNSVKLQKSWSYPKKKGILNLSRGLGRIWATGCVKCLHASNTLRSQFIHFNFGLICSPPNFVLFCLAQLLNINWATFKRDFGFWYSPGRTDITNCCFGCSDDTTDFPSYAKGTLSIKSQCKICELKVIQNFQIFMKSHHSFYIVYACPFDQKFQEKWCCILPKITNRKCSLYIVQIQWEFSSAVPISSATGGVSAVTE